MNSKIFKKIGTTIVASALAVNTLVFFPTFAESSTKYEFEDGEISGTSTTVMTTEKGYSGDGYVYLKDGGDTITIEVNAPSTGMYQLNVCYNLPTESGSKIQFIYINGENQGQITFSPNDGFSETSIGTFKLAEGKNTIKIESSWGWTMFDYLTVNEAQLSSFSASGELCDPDATDEAKSLMSYLADVYGSAIISGQQEYYGVSRDDEFDYIEELTGELPAIKGFDFGDTCPLYAWSDGTTDRMIEWANKGGIVTASWHVNVPTAMADYTLGSTMAWNETTYTQNTDFSVANVMIDGTVEHDYFLLAVENLATELIKLQDANVPVIFRPFHEAEGNGGEDGSGAWFWWSKEGASTYKELYKYLYSLLTEQYGLHNLIWEFNSYTYDSSYAWYPGADYVDIIGYDKYNATNWTTKVTTPNTSAISGIFYSLVDMYNSDGKPIAMAENDTIPSVENLISEKAGWLYFLPWYGEHLMDENYNTKASLKEIYQSEYVITLDELPENLYTGYTSTGQGSTTTTTSGNNGSSTTTTTTTKKVESTTTAETPKFDVKKYTVDNSDGGSKLEVTLNGTSNAYTNGCFGYSDGEDWVSVEWETTLDKDGNAVIEYEIPDGVSSLEVQIWWASVGTTVVENSAVSYSIDGKVTEFENKSDELEVTIWGDANDDGTVDIADAVAIASYVGDIENNALTEQGLVNADVQANGNGVNASDALAIQQYLAKIVEELPV